ncbi:MAG: DUF4184 family protein [Candidatus Bathyarchaeia archaeon]
MWFKVFKLPLPPLHMLSVLWLNFKWEKYFDPVGLVISSIILDLEPFLVLIFDLPYLVHGFWHSYLAGFIVSLLLAPVLYVLEKELREKVLKICRLFRLKFYGFPYSFSIIFLNCLLGTSLHVFLDSFTHERLPYVLFPLYVFGGHSNPFWFGINVAMIFELATIGLSLFSCMLWLKYYLNNLKQWLGGQRF